MTPILALALLALSGTEEASPATETDVPAVAVALPAGVLSSPGDDAPVRGEPLARPVKGPFLAAEAAAIVGEDAFAPRAGGPTVMVGDAAWHSLKFTQDPALSADHGAPMVVFEPAGPGGR